MLKKLFFFVLLLVGIFMLTPVIFIPFELTLGWDMPFIQKYHWGVHFIDLEIMDEDVFSSLLFWSILIVLIAFFIIDQSWKELVKRTRHY